MTTVTKQLWKWKQFRINYVEEKENLELELEMDCNRIKRCIINIEKLSILDALYFSINNNEIYYHTARTLQKQIQYTRHCRSIHKYI